MTPAVHADIFSPATLGWLLFLFAIAWSLHTAGSPGKGPVPDWKWWLLIGSVLLCFRWPLIWLPYELHMDESQLIAGAITLRHDPMFWRSVDGGTAGPLDFYPLMPAGFVTPPAGYALVRIMAAVLIAGTFAAIGEALACVSSRAVARLAILPGLAFEAFVTNKDFVHYSTELMPDFLLAVSAYVVVRQTVRPTNRNIWIAAVLLGAVPFAKLQAAPLAALVWLFLAGTEIRAGRGPNLGRLFVGAFFPLAMIALMVTVTGQAENLLIPYLLNNFGYVQSNWYPASSLIRFQWQGALTNGYLALWWTGGTAYFVGTLVPVRHAPKNFRLLQLAALGLLATAVFCILAPGRNYDHYVNFLTLPWCGVLGLSLAMVLQVSSGATVLRQRLLAGGFLACTLLPQLVLRASPRPDPYAIYNLADPGPAYRELAAAVRAITFPGESLAIWGWRSSLYVETGLWQATRQAHSEAQLRPGKWQAYFLRRYLADLQAAQPPVFVDAVGPTGFRYHDRSLGHEGFPELGDWVRTHYTFFGEVDAARIYVRNDRFAAAQRAWPPGRRKP